MIHEEEPDLKKVIVDEPSDDGNDMVDDDLDVLIRKEDEYIIGQAVLGKNLHDVYSHLRIEMAINRQSAEYMTKQLSSVDVVEVFSPERVGEMCSEFGLDQGMGMDLKSGFDFDLASDRARCWATVKKDKPMLVIGSPPCTLFSQLQELNKHMYRDSLVWMEKFRERMAQAKRYVKFCTEI